MTSGTRISCASGRANPHKFVPEGATRRVAVFTLHRTGAELGHCRRRWSARPERPADGTTLAARIPRVGGSKTCVLVWLS